MRMRVPVRRGSDTSRLSGAEAAAGLSGSGAATAGRIAGTYIVATLTHSRVMETIG